jgi:hypothetical protein
MLDESFLEPQEVTQGYKTLLPEHVDDSWRENPEAEYRVEGIDPGGTSGWCLFVIDKRALLDPGAKILDNIAFWSAGQWSGIEQRQARAASEMARAWGAAMVIEDFILRTLSGGRELLAPVRVTSAIEQDLYGSPFSIIKQQPAMAMSTMTDLRLKEQGLWLPGLPHANDATRHVLTWLRRKKALLAAGKSRT